MSMKTEMWKFETANFRVVATIEPDNDLDLSWDNSGEVREKLASGFYEAFATSVRVYMRGALIGEDHLGGSIYERPADFFREHFGLAARSREDGKNYGSYF